MLEEQALTELADLLYSYLPASGAIYTFGEAAKDSGVGDLWPGVKGSGLSKLPALTVLLENTLNVRRNRFCELVLQIVRAGLHYRSKKGDPVTASDIVKLNGAVAKFGFKIPELWDPAFLAGLPPGASAPPPPASAPSPDVAASRADVRRKLDQLRAEFLELHALGDRQEAGLSLEHLLNDLFALFDLKPHAAFRVVGEQIDGSMDLAGDVYLLEAKWTTKQINESELLVFRGKIEGKSQFTRGLFMSINGYTNEALEAITKGKSPNFVMLDGSHLYRVLEGHLRLNDLLYRAVRHLAETGEPYLPMNETM
jgi:hypothetical protein